MMRTRKGATGLALGAVVALAAAACSSSGGGGGSATSSAAAAPQKGGTLYTLNLGPHNGLDPQAFSQLHADLVFLFVGLTVAAVLVLRSVHAPRRAFDAALVLLAIEVAQAAVGFAQYFTGLPVGLVTLHLLGAAAVSAAMTWLLLGIRDRA